MKLNVKWDHKETEITTEPCVIEDVVELSEREYAKFYQNLMADYDFIREHGDNYSSDETQTENRVLLILGENQNDGILVDTAGSSYAKYTSYLPCARDIVTNDIRQLADYCVREGIDNTEDGAWSVTYDELYYHFDNAVVSDTNGYGKLLLEELKERAEVNEIIMTEDCIEMTYHMEYCENCQEGGIEGAMSLLSLMGCNLEDVHLCHEDEEHDLATVVELNRNTLTDEGKREWSDVLNAKVTSIYEGSYGVQIGISGCSAERLKDFSYMLAGYCSCEDYKKWVNEEQSGPTQRM